MKLHLTGFLKRWQWLKLIQSQAALLCVLLGSLISLTQNLIATAPKADIYNQATVARPMSPITISIPRIKMAQPVSPSIVTDDIWTITPKTANYWVGSARPGENSNIVVFGHNSRQVFAKLSTAQLGDVVELETPESLITYTIVRKATVAPDFADLIAPTTQETLSIYTCIGPFDAKRLVLQAKPVSIAYKSKRVCSL